MGRRGQTPRHESSDPALPPASAAGLHGNCPAPLAPRLRARWLLSGGRGPFAGKTWLSNTRAIQKKIAERAGTLIRDTSSPFAIGSQGCSLCLHPRFRGIRDKYSNLGL